MEKIPFKTIVAAYLFCMAHPFEYSIHYIAAEDIYYAVKNRDKATNKQ